MVARRWAGRFSSAFVAHEGSRNRYTHPENLIVQWTTEWGVPIALALLLVLTLALWKRLRTAEEPLVAGVCIAIIALTLQNLVDFSLELAGAATVVAALLGAVLPVSGRSSPVVSWAVSVGTMGVFSVVLLALAPRVLRSDTQSIVDRLTLEMQAGDGPRVRKHSATGSRASPNRTSSRAPRRARTLARSGIRIPRAGSRSRWRKHLTGARRMQLPHGGSSPAAEPIKPSSRSARPKIGNRGRGHKVLCEILDRFPQMDIRRASRTERGPRVAYLNRTVRCPGLPAELRAEIDKAFSRMSRRTWKRSCVRRGASPPDNDRARRSPSCKARSNAIRKMTGSGWRWCARTERW